MLSGFFSAFCGFSGAILCILEGKGYALRFFLQFGFWGALFWEVFFFCIPYCGGFLVHIWAFSAHCSEF